MRSPAALERPESSKRADRARPGPRGILGRLLTSSGRTAEAQDEPVQAIALFDRSKMTVQLERAKATLSKFSEI
jgi:hypothetical protein